MCFKIFLEYQHPAKQTEQSMLQQISAPSTNKSSPNFSISNLQWRIQPTELPALCQADTHQGFSAATKQTETHEKVIAMAQLDSPEIPVSP